jgi:hypothetical protein
MNPLVIFTRRHVREFNSARGDALGPRDERPGVERSLHVITILAARSTILHGVTLGRVEPVYAIHTHFEVQMATIHAREDKHNLGRVVG